MHSADHQAVGRRIGRCEFRRKIVEPQAQASQVRAVGIEAANHGRLPRFGRWMSQILDKIDEDAPGRRLRVELFDHGKLRVHDPSPPDPLLQKRRRGRSRRWSRRPRSARPPRWWAGPLRRLPRGGRPARISDRRAGCREAQDGRAAGGRSWSSRAR